MTTFEAINLLKDLRKEGNIPSDLNEEHPEYVRAIKFILENEDFDYESFVGQKPIITFGRWIVDSKGLRYDDENGYVVYGLDFNKFWLVREYEGVLLWEWLIHLTEKAWITKENVNDLNTAFLFCQDYFKEYRPKSAKMASTAKTLIYQRKIFNVQEKGAESDINI